MPYSSVMPAYPMLMDANDSTDLSEATSPTGMMLNGVALYRYYHRVIRSSMPCAPCLHNMHVLYARMNCGNICIYVRSMYVIYICVSVNVRKYPYYESFMHVGMHERMWVGTYMCVMYGGRHACGYL